MAKVEKNDVFRLRDQTNIGTKILILKTVEMF